MAEVNHWGRHTPSLADIVSDPTLRDHLISETTRMLGGSAAAARAAGDIMVLAERPEFEYEAAARALLDDAGLLSGGSRDLAREIELLHDLTLPLLTGTTLLDFGSGDGSMSRRFSESGFNVTMADVLQPAGPDVPDLPFIHIDSDGLVSRPDATFDDIITYSVLHHCQNPDAAFSEMLRLVRPGGRVVLVESVYGVSADDVHPDHPMHATAYGSMTPTQQFCHTMFFDHLVNRIVGSFSLDPGGKVSMPSNYNTPDGWNAAFERLGARPVSIVHLAHSVGRAPLHHTLHVVERVVN